MNNVNVDYSNFNENIIKKIVLELFKDVLFEVEVNNETPETLTLLMKDKISSNVEVSGAIDYDALNSLLKALSTMKKQMERS